MNTTPKKTKLVKIKFPEVKLGEAFELKGGGVWRKTLDMCTIRARSGMAICIENQYESVIGNELYFRHNENVWVPAV